MVALRVAVADQIAQDEPPEVWQTAQQLLADGRDRTAVMRQLVLPLTPSLMNVPVGGEEFDLDVCLAAPERLPIPSADEYERAVLDIVRDWRSASRPTQRAVAHWLATLVAERLATVGPHQHGGVSRPDLVADVGVLGDQVQSSASRPAGRAGPHPGPG